MRQKRKLPLEALAPYCVNSGPWSVISGEPPQPNPVALSFHDVFRNDNPVEIEVGSGKGLFLVTSAQARPDVNFLGIEVVKALQYYVAARLAKRQLTNARMACVDARWSLQHVIPASSVQAVHVYFPDPWWKARHKKRRVFTPEFARCVEAVLIPGGQLCIATDVEEYFGVMTFLVSEQTQLQEIDRHIESGAIRPDEVLTNFERKARNKGGSVWRARYARAT